MRNAYALLGVAFLILIFGTAYMVGHKTVQSVADDTTSALPERVQESLSPNKNTMFALTSPSFKEGESTPSEFTCDGKNKNPEFRITGAPEGTQSYALFMDDPDIPDSVKTNMGIEVFDHWVVFNIPSSTTQIEQNTVPQGAIVGKNSTGRNTYTGPCPPDKEHRYFWKLYALDTMLQLGNGATKAQVEQSMEGHILATTTLLSRYARVTP